MSNNRVYNVTRRFSMKHKQAVKAVENCACAWVEFGVSVRDLTLAESIAARNEKSRRREPIPFAELPGVVYRVAQRNEAGLRLEKQLAAEANQFARLATT